jgi:peptidoglycan/xylan/chitin deacetylase (PgdA/CDA1 family)
MEHPTTQHGATPPGCQFLFGNAAADGVCNDWVAADMRNARLSPAFRAYYRLRSLLPLPLRQLLQRYRRVAASARWCYPDTFTAELEEQISALGDELQLINPWPDDADFAFVLTHDVESAEGARRVPTIADMEEKVGFRSSWNFVPHKYPIDAGLLRDLADRGFEIGVHGYNHDGRLFANGSIFNHRAHAINAALKAWGAVGFRAPMVHRNLHWLQSLEIQYDASCFDADPYQAMPGGVGSVWPFIAGRFVELPYTLPQDHTLFIALGERDGRIWERKLDYIAQLRGMSLVITHPDYLDSISRLETYRRLLHRAMEMGGNWHALPKDVAAWWHDREALRIRRKPDGSVNIEGRAAARANIASIHTVSATSSRRSQDSPQRLLEWRSIPKVCRAESGVLQ